MNNCKFLINRSAVVDVGLKVKTMGSASWGSCRREALWRPREESRSVEESKRWGVPQHSDRREEARRRGDLV